MNNPIKENRIVNNKTFAIRFRNFIRNANVLDQASEEERDYLLYVANELLMYQIETCKEDIEEFEYLKRIKNLIKL